MSKKCKSCKLYGLEECPRVIEGLSSDPDMTACGSYKRKGYRTAAVTAITTNCPDTSCRYWTDETEQHPDNCLKGVHDRKKPGGHCKFWEFGSASRAPKRCDKKDCVYYAKGSKTGDNCNIGAFGLDKCEYMLRQNTNMKAEVSDQTFKKAKEFSIKIKKTIAQENEIEPKQGENLPYSVLITRKPTLSELVKILQVLLTDTGLEITIRPANK